VHAEGTAWERAHYHQQQTIEYTNPISDLLAGPPSRRPPTGMGSSDYYEHPEAKLCLCHMATPHLHSNEETHVGEWLGG
jgi:hypothetical protein